MRNGTLPCSGLMVLTLAVFLANGTGCMMSNRCYSREEVVLTSATATRPQADEGVCLLRVEWDGTVILRCHTQTVACKLGQTVPLASDSTVHVESSNPATQQAKVVIEHMFTTRPVWF